MTIFKPAVAALAAAALLFSTASIGANRAAAVAARESAKSGSGAKLSATLAVLQKASDRRISQQGITRDVKHKLPALRASQGYVSVSAYGDDLVALRAQLEAKGLKNAVAHSTAVSGKAPIAALRDMSETQGLKFLRPTLAMARKITSQGDRSLRADLARRESGATGKGIRVGALSDSYDCAPGPFEPGAPFTRAAQDVANDDLPANVLVLKDLSATPSDDCSDEGRP